MPQYLFSSSSKTAGGLFLLNSRTRRFRRLHPGPFRGVTPGPGGCYFAVSGYRDPREGHSVIHRIDPRAWTVEPLVELPLADCHDFRWIDGSFFLVASLGNQIVRLDPEMRIMDRMQIVEDERDICHLNCLIQHDGQMFASIFTLSPGERKKKRRTGAWHNEGKILALDYGARKWEIAYETVAQPHSLIARNGGICLVESHTSCISEVDLHRRAKRVLRQHCGFLRGLAIGPDEAVLGVCRFYTRDRRRLRPLPWHLQWQEKLFPFSGLLFLDPMKWSVRGRIPIPGAEVYDIHRLPDGAAVPPEL